MPFRATILSEQMPEGPFLIPDNVFRPSRMGMVGNSLYFPSFSIGQTWVDIQQWLRGAAVETQQ